jgi:hypothetical protein
MGRQAARGYRVMLPKPTKAAKTRKRRNSKFNANPTRCRSQNLTHHSAMEAARCDELHALQGGGLIRDLEAHPQPSFDLRVNDVHICHYLADFAYTDAETGQRVVEDVKGFATAEYKLKCRLMLAVKGIEVQEVRKVRGRR